MNTMSYREICPKRVVVSVHHTISTWLPVTLSCGHVENLSFSVNPGFEVGCTQCAEASFSQGGLTAEDRRIFWRLMTVSQQGRALKADRRDSQYMAKLAVQKLAGVGTPAQRLYHNIIINNNFHQE